MDNIKKRSEIKEEDKWQLDKIYPDIDSFNKDYIQVEKDFSKLEELANKFLETSKAFKEFFIFDSKVSRTLEKLWVYAHCKKDEDTSNVTYQELSDKLQLLYTKYSEITSNISPQIIKEDEAKIMAYLDEEKELASYKHMIKSLFRQKRHCLNEESEKLIATLGPVLNNASNTYTYLTNTDLKFGTIRNEKEEEVELSETVYSTFISSKNRRVREEAFKTLYNGYASFKNTITSLYSSILNYDSINAKLRGYKSSLESYLDKNNIPTALYDNLIDAVRANLPSLHKYFKIKKELLGLDEFHLYDGYVSTVKNIDKKYTFEEAKELVVNALKVLGESYTSKLNEAFTQGWIDKYPNKAKHTGAYSTGSYDTLPYLLLNYTNEYNDVSTLAHELGHSMHTYFSNTNQPFETSGYVIFLAEIASTTNELLLNHYMLEKVKTKEEKMCLLNELLDLFKSTIYRQTMFAEFEKKAHEYLDMGNVVTNEYLNNLYYELNKDYFGKDVVVDEEIKYEWSRIPHFYTPFYVYQYATSLSISCYVAQNILNNTPGFKEKYLELLKAGGSDYPLELLKIIDIDLTDKKVFESANQMFNDILNQFIEVYNS